MKKAAIFFAPGFEEIEALTPADVLRRAGAEVELISITEDKNVTGGHGLTIVCDRVFDGQPIEYKDILILPGGIPGAQHLKNHEKLTDLIREYDNKKKWIAAICAAPMILGELEMLKDRKASCFPGFEHHLKGAHHYPVPAITDGHIITGRGIGAAMEFSIEIISNLFGPDKAAELREKMVVPEIVHQ
ncbi:DJ-1 family glyoxalase III [Marinilabilia rubra]|uniref:DJ-1 family protein n=1 Tax=Marinilabilia rubra TaxID=2162893 RepID=A0A2U2B4B1_9BACT|nr:DJ-1 family glyoxalase III [Marinilabilia rubra]PWD97905.1 DJ-1 family protein [Marinilabilia rubra]